MRRVSIHASAREATLGHLVWTHFRDRFYPRLRTGGDSPEAGGSISAWRFLSTPPHGRRPGRRGNGASEPNVSIHASAREATRAARWRRGSSGSFYPRLRTGGDSPTAWQAPPDRSFYPRLRTGGDKEPGAPQEILDVSIHASAREATQCHRRVSPRLWFLSTPPHGRRPGRWNRERMASAFLSTPPHGRRPAPSGCSAR